MVARIRLLQLAIGLVNFAIVALAFTSIWPFPSGQFNVDLPSSTEITWTYDGGVVHVSAPYSIDNGGFYDVKNLVLNYTVTNDTRYQLADQVIVIGDIPAGQVTSSVLDFQFDLLGLFNSGAQWMVLNDDLLRFYLGVSCLYTGELVKFEAEYRVNVPWDALIRDYGVSEYTWGSTSTPFGEAPDSLNITYWLDTSDMLAPFSPASVELSIRGNSTLLGQGTTGVTLGGNHTGVVNLAIDPSGLLVPDPPTMYFIDIRITVAEFTIHKTIEIEAPSLLGGIP